jgi:hypothetical protein
MAADEQDLVGMLEGSARLVGHGFTDPEDDWPQLAVFDAPQGVSMMPIDELMSDKDMLDRAILPKIVRELGATRVVLVLNTWHVKADEDGTVDIPPSEHPDRRECLMLFEMTASGITQAHRAEIQRDDEGHRTLGAWENLDAPGTSGRFIEHTVEALQEVTYSHM